MIQAINKYIILKVTTKKSAIIIQEKANKLMVEKIEVVSIGDEVKKVKLGQSVAIGMIALGDANRLINPFDDGTKKGDDEYYTIVEEKDIIGIY